ISLFAAGISTCLKEPLQGLLRREIELSKERSFLLLACFYDKQRILTCMDGFFSQETARQDFVLEVLIELLGEKLAEDLFAYKPECSSSNPSEILTHHLKTSPHCEIASITSCTIYAIGEL